MHCVKFSKVYNVHRPRGAEGGCEVYCFESRANCPACTGAFTGHVRQVYTGPQFARTVFPLQGISPLMVDGTLSKGPLKRADTLSPVCETPYGLLENDKCAP